MANAPELRETASSPGTAFEERVTVQQAAERFALRRILRLALLFAPICIAGYVGVVAIALRDSGENIGVMIGPAVALGVLFAIGVVGLCIGAVFANETLADLDNQSGEFSN